MRYFVSFALIRLFTFPFSLLPYPWLHAVGRRLGRLAYYLLPRFRKRALSNLALAQDLALSHEEIIEVAKQSFENLVITCLEYPKLAREKNIERIAKCENPERACAILENGTGVIFLCAHQANWEMLFLEGTRRMKGTAIGRPIKNRLLYRWVVAMREKYGGKVIEPKQAVREGLRTLKQGAFLGIVGDQGMPESPFSSPFLGRKAWSSSLPALLSVRTGCPILVASTQRNAGRYQIRYSEPLYPRQNTPLESEVERLMCEALSILETSIKARPGEWLWQHNRWKQQTRDKLKRKYRHDAILIILPKKQEGFEKITPHLSTFREIYPREFITVLTPDSVLLPDAEILLYKTPEELFRKDLRFKLVFNFTQHKKLRSHFLGLSALNVTSLQELQKGATTENLSEILKKELSHAR